jgi:hypothetical protein
VRFLYLLLVPCLAVLLVVGGRLFLRADTALERASAAFYVIFSALGLPIVLPAMRQAWRGKAVDGRLAQAWILAFLGGNSLVRYAREAGLLNLLIGLGFVAWGVGQLVAFLRHPQPPPPEPEPPPAPILAAASAPAEPVGCAPFLALGLVLLAVALFVARQLRIL